MIFKLKYIDIEKYRSIFYINIVRNVYMFTIVYMSLILLEFINMNVNNFSRRLPKSLLNIIEMYWNILVFQSVLNEMGFQFF